MARIAAERLAEHLDLSGFVVMKKPPASPISDSAAHGPAPAAEGLGPHAMAERDRDGVGSLRVGQALWRVETGGVALATEIGGLRLVVDAAARFGGDARFVVRRRVGEADTGTLVGSGFKATVAEAMRAAERMADRLVS